MGTMEPYIEHESSPRCLDCGSSDSVCVGKIASTNSFAGRLLDRVLDGGYLWSCPNCQLRFRWPQMTKTKLDELYAEGAEYAWDSSPDRRQDWKTVKKWIDDVQEPISVLDIGCFDDGFLGCLSKTHHRYGVEINSLARARAQAEGVVLLGTDFETFSPSVEAVRRQPFVHPAHSVLE